MMRKLLEALTKFAGEPEQKPGEQWKGTDKGTPGKQLVGDSIIKDLSKGVTPKTKEEELAEAFANFNEDDLGVEEKRPGRKSDRPSREYTKNGKPSKRYTPVKEGWMNGSDRVNLPDGPMTYWNGTGRLQNEYNELYEKLVPSQGAAETIEGEVLRASSKIVYRHFNDGDLFNQASFDQLEQYIGRVANYDDLAEKAIEFALKAQGNYHPNTGWDSLDVMDYGPTDDDNGWDEEDEYDDEDDTNWEEEDDELEEADMFKAGQRAIKNIKSATQQRKSEAEKMAIAQAQIDADRENERDRFSQEELYPSDDSHDLDESTDLTLFNLDRALSRYNMEKKSENPDPIRIAQLKKIIIKYKEDLNTKKYGHPEDFINPNYDSKTGKWLHSGIKRPVTFGEGWESGPDEPRTQERDPDAEYDARRQEKLDAEADSAPKTTTYQCVGRGPNDEPNYKFGPEHNTSEEAVAYRKKLMANPKTPNPRDIGIRTISKVAKGINEDVTSTDPLEGALLDAIHELIGQGHTDVDPMVLTNMVVAATSRPFLLKDLVDANNNSQAVQHYIDSISPSKVKFSSDMLTVKNEDPAKDKAKAQAGVSSMASRAANRNRLGEGTETPLQNKEDYNAKRKALQDIQLDPDTAKDPQLKAEVIRRLASLNQQYSMLREQISKFKESRGTKAITTKLDNMDNMRNVQIPTPAERREQLRIAKEKEQAGKKQVKEFAAPGMNPATPVATNTAAKPDPATVAKAAAATSTLKTATGTTVGTQTLDKALDSATQGTATSTDVKALAPIIGVVNQAAQDPKLAAQFKTIANQAKLAK